MRLPLTSDCLIHHSQCGTSMPNSEGESMLLRRSDVKPLRVLPHVRL